MKHLALLMIVWAVASVSCGAAPLPVTVSMPAVTPPAVPTQAPTLPAWTGPGFSPPPAPGVHPRVLISPEDLPAMRQRLQSTACGRRAEANLHSSVSSNLHGRKALGKTYAALVAGDPQALSYAETDWWRGRLAVTLSFEALDCLIRQDAQRGQALAAALVTYAGLTKGIDMEKNPDYQMGLAYDFDYGYMTDQQRTTIRQVIARATAGKSSHGMDMPSYLRTYNWMPAGTKLALLALCIEGEEGYDRTVYSKTADLMRDFLTYGIYPSGSPTEGMHYFNFGMHWGAMTMVAMAKRGDVLLNHPHWKALANWYLQEMEPFGDAFSMHGDTPNDNGGLLDNYALLKWAYPNDPVVDFIWRNRVHDDYSGTGYYASFLFTALYPSDWIGGSPAQTPKAIGPSGANRAGPLPPHAGAPWNPAALGQPLSWFSPDLGYLVTRTEWSPSALEVNFDCRQDLHGAGHTHADRLGFTLSALGRKWAIDRGFHVAETKDHCCVLIDGDGEGFFPPGGKFLAYLDAPLATLAAGDAKYAYDYRYNMTGRLRNPENRDFHWDTLMKSDFLEGRYVSTAVPFSLEAAKTIGTIRASNNPVQRAFRSMLLVRGKFPYVLILDDFQKDAAEHLYQWLMQTPDDLAMAAGGDAGAALQAANDPAGPKLLVQTLEMAGAGAPARLETYEVKRSANTGDTQDFGPGKRLVLESRAVAPEFKVLLFPHLPQTPLPKTSWNADHTRLTVEWDGQRDEYTFQPLVDGRTGFVLARNGGGLVSCGLARFKTSSGVAVEAAASGANVALSEGVLTVSGSGWKSLEVSGTPIHAVQSDGSVATATATASGVRLTEKAL